MQDTTGYRFATGQTRRTATTYETRFRTMWDKDMKDWGVVKGDLKRMSWGPPIDEVLGAEEHYDSDVPNSFDACHSSPGGMDKLFKEKVPESTSKEYTFVC